MPLFPRAEIKVEVDHEPPAHVVLSVPVADMMVDLGPTQARALAHALSVAADQADPILCSAICPCCNVRCSGKHTNQLHGVDPDNHWGGPKF